MPDTNTQSIGWNATSKSGAVAAGGAGPGAAGKTIQGAGGNPADAAAGTILALNRVRCFRRFHGLATSTAYYLATVLNSMTRIRQPLHRRALVALVWPPARPEPVRGHRLLARWPR